MSLLVFRFFFTPPGVPVPFSPLTVFRFHFYPSGCSGVLSTPSPCSVWHHAPSWCSGRFSCPRDAPVGPLATLDPFDAPVVDAVIYALDTDPHAINFNGRSCYGVARVGQGPTSRRAARLRRTNWCAGMRRHRPAIASASHTPPRIFLMHCGALCRPSEMCCCSSPRALAGSSSPPVDQCPSRITIRLRAARVRHGVLQPLVVPQRSLPEIILSASPPPTNGRICLSVHGSLSTMIGSHGHCNARRLMCTDHRTWHSARCTAPDTGRGGCSLSYMKQCLACTVLYFPCTPKGVIGATSGRVTRS